MARDPMVEVELVAAPGSPSGAPTGAHAPVASTDPSPDRTRDRRRGRLLVAGAAAVAAGLLVTQAVLDARERAAYARVADLPGVLLPVGDGLEPLWPADGAATAGEWAVTTWNGPRGRSDGLALGATFDADGVPRAGAFDATTGEVLWSVELAEPDPVLAAEGTEWWIHCESTPAGRHLLACVVPQQHVAAQPDEDPDVVEGDRPPVPTAAELVVLDARTHEEVLRVAVAPLATLTLVGDLVVTAHAGPDRSMTVAARDLRTGADVWSHTTPPGTAREPRHGDPRESTPMLGRLGETVVVQGGASVVRLAADGSLVSTSPLDAGEQDFAYVHVARERHAVLQVYPRESGSGRAHLLDADGAWVDLPVTEPVRLPVDDGSEPDLLLLSGSDGIVAYDVRAREVRWELASTSGDVALVLGGNLYLSTRQGGLVALDLADGTELWRAELGPDERWPGGYSPEIATDGRAVLLLHDQDTGGPGQGPTVTAHALADGRRLWSQPLPDGVDYLGPAGRVLMGRGGDDGRVVQAFG
ncbi:PQQ-binding-like beta-propeller repeat protein [Cellulomonas cellasea]|uniref:Pyrrolo-quinoline quinone repeat domain-containing protein n=2 Tax=Cellulomonas cellasea TaxID=43670 RepID=A0A0A0B2V8_9CELL|nr:PQQ-binding-like beta-propeller repeat protein [Cellulomonas cellasea]KGM00453.1 hypothetical protein Q760_08790 [Cellulomonas cellasea DSM 20118]GEA88159.1 hypothetical protein CCE01nite_21080 [Cellulomonas cellasea]